MVILNEEAEVYVKSVIQTFEVDPLHSIYDNVIQPPIAKPHLPRLFIWAPLEHFNFSMNCFVHKSLLLGCGWTDNLTVDKHANNPRLIYDIGTNILLIQRIYKCNAKPNKHDIKAATLPLFERYPVPLSPYHFPFKKYRRSMVSFNMIEHIFKGIIQDSGFLKMAEGFSALSYGHFQRIYGDITESFYSNILYSVLSSDKIENIFLDTYNDVKASIDANNVIPLLSISIDFSYQAGMSYNNGEEQKDVLKFLVFLSETGQVISYKVTKEDNLMHSLYRTLCEIKDKVSYSESTVKFVYADNCCEVREILASLLPDVSVKKDLQHTINGVRNCIPDNGGLHEQIFMKEFRLIFRQDNDRGDKREMPTANAETLLINLTNFLSNKNSYIERLYIEKRKRLLSLIDMLKCHIITGCLSDIPVGNGSESIEKFQHEFDNKKLVSRFYMYSPDLAKSVFSVLIGAYNCHLKEKSHCSNAKLIPFLPKVAVSPLVYPPRSSDKKPFEDLHLLATANILSAPLLLKLVCRIYHTYNSIKVLENILTGIDMKIENYMTLLTPLSKPKSLIVETDQLNFSIKKNILKKNGCYFDLHLLEEKIDLFECVYKQIRYLEETTKGNTFSEWLSDLGLHDTVSNEEMIKKLRKLCADEIRSQTRYKNINIPINDEILDKLEETGSVPSGIDILAIDAMANVLGSPIIVISSDEDKDISVHLPMKNQATYSPLFLCYLSIDSGSYYKCVFGKDEEELTSSVVNCCRCNAVCQSTRCPCVKSNISCSVKCSCKNCENNKELFVSKGRCRCGERCKTNQSFCINESSRRASKCPCLKGQSACTAQCTCRGCANIYGVAPDKSSIEKVKTPRKHREEKSYRKQTREESYNEISEEKTVSGIWSFQEVAALISCTQMIVLANINFSVETIHVIYSAVCECYPITQMGMRLQLKSIDDIFNKLSSMKLVPNDVITLTTDHTEKEDEVIKSNIFETVVSENVEESLVLQDLVNISPVKTEKVVCTEIVNNDEIEFSLNPSEAKCFIESCKRHIELSEDDMKVPVKKKYVELLSSPKETVFNESQSESLDVCLLDVKIVEQLHE